MSSIHTKSSAFSVSFLPTQRTARKLVLTVAGAIAISACQPTDSTSDSASTNKNTNDTAVASGEGGSALTPKRTQTVEALAGVPMQQLVTFDPQEIKQGGDTGISITSSESYSKPSSNLSASRKGSFFYW